MRWILEPCWFRRARLAVPSPFATRVCVISLIGILAACVIASRASAAPVMASNTARQAASAGVPDGSRGTIFVWTDDSGRLLAQHIDAHGARLWPVEGVEVAGGAQGSAYPITVGDGAGGVIVTWIDGRTLQGRVLVQRLDANGTKPWGPSGIELRATASYLYVPARACTDGAGGAFVTWSEVRDGRTPSVFMQKISAAGALLWVPDGVPIAATANEETFPSLLSDGAGGAIVWWTRNGGGIHTRYAPNA